MSEKDTKLSTWVSVAANLAVLGGLILVAVQINQNTAVIRGAAYQTWVAAAMDHNLAIAQGALGGIMDRGHTDPRDLTQDTYIDYALVNLNSMQMAQATDYLYREGSLDRSLWEVEIQRAALLLTFRGVRNWWDAGGKTQLTPAFVQLLESTDVEIDAWGWDPEVGFVQGYEQATESNAATDAP